MGHISIVIWPSIIYILFLVICNLLELFRLLTKVFSQISATLFCQKVHLQGLANSLLNILAEIEQHGKTWGYLSRPSWTQTCLESLWQAQTLVDTLATQMRQRRFAQDGSSFQHSIHLQDKTMIGPETTLSLGLWMMFIRRGLGTQSSRGCSFQGNFTLAYI